MRLKKILLTILLIMPIMVFADQLTIKDTNIKNITFPDSWYTITRNNLEDIPKDLNFDTSYYQTMYDNDYYLHAINSEKNINFILIKKNIDINSKNFNMLSDQEILDTSQKIGFKYNDTSIYRTTNYVFLKNINIEINTNIIYIYDYITIANNNLYQISVKKDNIKFTNTEKRIIDNIINSIEFKNMTDITESDNQKSKSFIEFIRNLFNNIIFIVILAILVITLIVITIIICSKKAKKKPDNAKNINNNAINYQPNDYNENEKHITHLQANNIYDSELINDNSGTQDNNYENTFISQKEKSNINKPNIKKENPNRINPLMDIKLENTNNNDNNIK